MQRFLTPLAAILTGVAMAAALPPWGWWPLAFAGLVGFDRLLADQPVGARFRRGLLVGVGLYVPSLAWLIDMTMPGYVIAAVAYAALLGVAAMIVPPAAPARWVALPGAVAAVELLRWSWPFGGVPLSSLAVGQVSGPLAPVLRLGGTLLLVEVTVVAGVGFAALVARHWKAAGVAALVVVAAVGLAAVAPRGHQVGTLDVALVQGGGKQGTRASNTDERKVFERHLAASELIDGPVDLVVWPEDVVDTEGPVVDNREGDELSALARRLDASLIVGVVEGVDRDYFRNASVAFDADGEVVDRYDKVHRVPFGEYVPLRSLLEPFGGSDLTSRDAVVGDHPAQLDTPAGLLSVAISWEVFFGDRVREGVGDGAGVVLNPTNGSSFTGTLVQTQQVASSRMRAIESGRWVLQAAPTGFSAIVEPDGTVDQRSAVSEQAVLQATVGTREGTTLYTRYGLLFGVAVALVSLTVGRGVPSLRSRRRSPGAVIEATADGGADAGAARAVEVDAGAAEVDARAEVGGGTGAGGGGGDELVVDAGADVGADAPGAEPEGREPAAVASEPGLDESVTPRGSA
jgi:apolipoprotein N-acyltransferase